MIHGRAAAARREERDPLDLLSFDIGRAHCAYKHLLERTLVRHGLDGVVRPGMGPILFALFEEDGCNIKDLVARSQLSFPAITVMLDQMEKDGLVERRRDRLDGRAVRVCLTPLARSIEPRCRKVLARLNEVLAEDMSQAEVRRLRELMARMIGSMKKDEFSGGR